MNLNLMRQLGAAMLAVAVVVVWFSMKPDVAQPRTFSTGLDSALATGRANAASDTTVYQQQVSNGWIANDLLELLVRQEDAHSRLAPASDRRIPAELVLLTLALALLLATTPVPQRKPADAPGTGIATPAGWVAGPPAPSPQNGPAPSVTASGWPTRDYSPPSG